MNPEPRTKAKKPWRQRAKETGADTYALYLAYRDPRVPWHAKALMALVVIYAFSPIDLIPDFLPVLGQLDDLVLIPLGVALAARMVPPEVWAEYREKARTPAQTPVSRVGCAIIACAWLFVAFGLWKAMGRWL